MTVFVIGDDNTMEIQGENCQDAKYHNTKCDQETQTELFKLPIADLHESMEEKHKESLWVQCIIEYPVWTLNCFNPILPGL